MHIAELHSRLWTLSRWLVAILILKVFVIIVSNYVDYFPPNFDSDFLLSRRYTFFGWYQWAFYTHLFSAPFTLVVGLLLINDRFRRRWRRAHRILGRLQVAFILLGVVPSSFVMANYSLAGTISNYAFLASTAVTMIVTLIGWRTAVQRNFVQHRRWMLRCYVMLCSAVVLRIMMGTSILLNADPVWSYRIVSWISWIVPLAILEVYLQIQSTNRIKHGIAYSKSSPTESPDAIVPNAPQTP